MSTPPHAKPRTADPETSADAAMLEAQKLAFAPIIFQAACEARDMGVLDVLFRAGAHGATADEVTAATGLRSYAASLLLEASFAAGLCAYSERRFSITKMGVFWTKDRMTRVNAEFSSHVCYRSASRLGESLRSGLPAGLRELGPWRTVYEGLAELPAAAKQAWFAFDHYYSAQASEACLARVLEGGPRHLVDIGGNTGGFAERCLAASPSTRVTIVDLPQQIGLAKAALAKSEAARDRVTFAPVDLLADRAALPPGADVYWMSQFLDCFSEPQIASILARVREAMPPRGRVYVLETFWDKQRFDAARTCVIGTSLYFACVANGNSRMYACDDMRRLVRDAGLTVEREWHDVGVAHSLLECRR
ncbi:MAG TPA: methyltransferase [Polyangiaceae bacterium]|nr:methyltransferase [Polyangiaceae bacterium]